MFQAVMSWITVIMIIVIMNAGAARAKTVFGATGVLAFLALGFAFALWAPSQLGANEAGYTATLVAWTTSLVLIIAEPGAPKSKEVNTGSR